MGKLSVGMHTESKVIYKCLKIMGLYCHYVGIVRFHCVCNSICMHANNEKTSTCELNESFLCTLVRIHMLRTS